MKLYFLGSAPSLHHDLNDFHSNLLLETASKKRLLINCGADIRYSLKSLNDNGLLIDALYISEIGIATSRGLEWIGFINKFNPSSRKPTLYLNPHLVKPLWDNYLSGGMQTLAFEQATLDTYFNVNPVHDQFQWENHIFDLIESCGLFFNNTYFSLGNCSLKTCENTALIFQNAEMTSLEKIPKHIKEKMWLYGSDSIDDTSDFQGVVKKGMEFSL